MAARAIKVGEANLIIAGGVESMSRAPYVMGKSDSAFGRSQKIEDTTMGWRFINPKLKEIYGVAPKAGTPPVSINGETDFVVIIGDATIVSGGQ
jgi:acetyl-CoA acetyltransferase